MDISNADITEILFLASKYHGAMENVQEGIATQTYEINDCIHAMERLEHLCIKVLEHKRILKDEYNSLLTDVGELGDKGGEEGSRPDGGVTETEQAKQHSVFLIRQKAKLRLRNK